MGTDNELQRAEEEDRIGQVVLETLRAGRHWADTLRRPSTCTAKIPLQALGGLD